MILTQLLALLSAAVVAQLPQAQAAVQEPPATIHALIIAGVGGEPQYEKTLYEMGKGMVDAMRMKYGVPDSMITFLAEHPSRDAVSIRGPSTKAEIERAFARIAAAAGTGDFVFVLLLGHGTPEGEHSRFNVSGPDMIAADFAKLLAPLSKQRVAFVNAASASGDFIATLAGKNRAIITATKSVAQVNFTKFARHLVAAYAADSANTDSDNDGCVSLLEAFVYARREVTKEYASTNHLQPEHARLDDNGDGEGTDAPGVEAPDGKFAAGLCLRRHSVPAERNDPTKNLLIIH